MKPQTNVNKPAYEVFVVEGEGESTYWTKIGAAWPTKDGKGFSIRMSALPLDGRVVLREPRQAEQPQDAKAA